MAQEPAITVLYNELSGSPTDGYDEEGQYFATRMLKCAWADRDTLMSQLLGGFRDTDTGELVLPASFPDKDEARALSASARPLEGVTGSGSDSTVANYQNAIVTVRYTVRRISFQTGESVKYEYTHKVEPSAEFITLPIEPYSAFYFPQKEDVPKEEPPVKLISTTKWVLSIKFAPSLSTNIKNMAGKVNSAAISSNFLPDSGWTMGAETVRYDGGICTQVTNPDGDDRWNIDLIFQHLNWEDVTAQEGGSATWNHVLQSGTSEPTRLYSSPTLRTEAYRLNIYDTVDLNTLLGAYL